MQTKKWLGLSVLLVAMVLAINAFAFSTASVDNAFSIQVSTTGTATLAITPPASKDPGVTTSAPGASTYSLTIDEDVQPGSTYVFEDVMAITNNATYPVTLTYSIPSLTGVTLTLRDASNVDISGQTLAAGGTVEVKLEVVSTTGANTGNASGTLVITADR